MEGAQKRGKMGSVKWQKAASTAIAAHSTVPLRVEE